MRELMPSNWGRKQSPKRSESNAPISVLGEFDRLFDEALSRRFGLSALGEMFGGSAQFSPAIDVEDRESAIEITAELPGLEEKDVELSLGKNMLTISGEKRYEHEEEHNNEYRMERRFGSFTRSIQLPEGLDTENAQANFNNGVLTVTLPKTGEYKDHVRKIAISRGS